MHRYYHCNYYYHHNDAYNDSIETIRLWKKYAGNNVKFASKLLTLEKKVKKELDSIDKFEAQVAGVDNITNATVVLLFDSKLSDGNDSEYSNRLNGCLDVLKSSCNDAGRHARQLLALDCNNISCSCPPSWCLYLTHSAQYLSKLLDAVELSESKHNAKVPIAFDTNSRTISFDDKFSKMPKVLRTSERNKDEKLPECTHTITIIITCTTTTTTTTIIITTTTTTITTTTTTTTTNTTTTSSSSTSTTTTTATNTTTNTTGITEIVDDEDTRNVLNQLTQHYGDEAITRVIASNIKEEEEAEGIGSKRKRNETVKSFDKKSRANDEKQFENGYRVISPYGIGTVIGIMKNKYDNNNSDTIKVQLKWGVGYFQPDSLTVTDTFRFINNLTFENVRQIIKEASSYDPVGHDDTKIGNMMKAVKHNIQNKFLYSIAGMIHINANAYTNANTYTIVLMIKKGVSQSNIAKALSVTGGNVSSWMLGTNNNNIATNTATATTTIATATTTTTTRNSNTLTNRSSRGCRKYTRRGPLQKMVILLRC